MAFETGSATMCLERGRGRGLCFFSSTFWQLSQSPRCHDQTSKRSQDEETTNSEDTEARTACYHPIPNLSVLVSDVSLTHSSFSLRLAERVCLCLSIRRPSGTVHLGCVLISGTPLWTGKFPEFYSPHLICSYWI